MQRTPPRPPRRIRRWFTRLTAAALGAAAAPTADAAVGADLMTRGPAAADVAPDEDPPGYVLDEGDPRLSTAAQWLAVSLERMEPLPATYTACTWALSPDPAQRATIAASLEWTFSLAGDDVIVDHLSRDPEPRVRAAIARAAWTRRAADDVLTRLADDPSPEVREVAQLAMRGR